MPKHTGLQNLKAPDSRVTDVVAYSARAPGGPARPAARPLRGRSAELEALLGALRSTRTGRASVVVVRGEPGIGKTALLRAGLEQAARLGFAAGYSAAHTDDRTVPFASLGPALRSGGGALVDAAQFMDLSALYEQPLWLAERLADLLEQRAAAGPILLAVDDAQWCDPLSLFILRVLPRRLAAARVVWVLASRDVAGGGPSWEIAHAARSEVPTVEIELGVLDHEAIVQVAHDALGRAPESAVLRRLDGAGGNPFLTVHVLDGLFEPRTGPGSGHVPAGLIDGVHRRLAATSEPCRALVRVAAVFGDSCVLEDAAALLGTTATRLTEALAEAIDASLLTDEGSTLRFRHDLLREAVYEDLPPSGRRAMHRAASAHLLAHGRGWAAAAPHVLATAEPGDLAAAETLRKAAHEVLEKMSVTAAVFIRHAFDLIGVDDPAWGEVGADAVAILVFSRQLSEAVELAHTLLGARLPVDLQARIRLLLLPGLWAAGRRTEMIGFAHPAGASPAFAARLIAYRALAGRHTAEPARTRAAAGCDAVAALLDCLAQAERAESDGRTLQAHRLFASAHTQVRRLAGKAGEDGVPDAGVLALREAAALARLDDLERAAHVLREHADDSWLAPHVELLNAHLAFGAGRLDEAAASAAASLALMRELSDWTREAEARQLTGLIAVLRGEFHEARAQLSGEQAHDDAGPGPGAGWRPLVRALLADAEGDSRGAAEIVTVLSGDHGFAWPADLLMIAACSAFHRGQSDTLDSAVRLLEGLAHHNPSVASITGARLLAAALSTGEFEPVLKHLHESPRRLLLARTHEEAGRFALRSGNTAGAASDLAAAREQYAALGAGAWVARMDAVMQNAGLRRRPASTMRARPETGWEALTKTERRVALLVARGHTNRSAAAELVLSPSTINTHLRSVFNKLGVHSRVALANAVLRGDDTSAD